MRRDCRREAGGGAQAMSTATATSTRSIICYLLSSIILACATLLRSLRSTMCYHWGYWRHIWPGSGRSASAAPLPPPATATRRCRRRLLLLGHPVHSLLPRAPPAQQCRAPCLVGAGAGLRPADTPGGLPGLGLWGKSLSSSSRATVLRY